MPMVIRFGFDSRGFDWILKLLVRLVGCRWFVRGGWFASVRNDFRESQPRSSPRRHEF